jgi:hypothetical protein
MACSDDNGGGNADGDMGGGGDGPVAGKDAGDSGAPDADATPNLACEDTAKKVVKLPTDDGLNLEADLYLSGAANGPAVVLLHMVPPQNDRTNYPQAFIDALVAKGATVLNVDRRGTAASGGDATEAHEGPKGKLDAKAAYDFLQKHACVMDLSRVIFVGASNGTTTALDFTVHAGAEAAITLPRALVFLTGGAYTENQNKIADNIDLLKAVPILFVYSSAEATWSAAFKATAPPVWEFLEYSGVSATAGHGTGIFAAKPESINAVARFVEQSIKK